MAAVRAIRSRGFGFGTLAASTVGIHKSPCHVISWVNVAGWQFRLKTINLSWTWLRSSKLVN